MQSACKTDVNKQHIHRRQMHAPGVEDTRLHKGHQQIQRSPQQQGTIARVCLRDIQIGAICGMQIGDAQRQGCGPRQQREQKENPQGIGCFVFHNRHLANM